MAHLLETAPTGRAKCRGCGAAIAKGDLRFGERLPNPFSDDGGEMTHWFHLWCAAFRRPEPFLETVRDTTTEIPDLARMMSEADLGIAHRRAPRVSVTERASTGRAICRHCKQPILKDAWRLALLYYEDGRFAPAGFVHVSCGRDYFETPNLLARIRHFSPALTEDDLTLIETVLTGEA